MNRFKREHCVSDVSRYINFSSFSSKCNSSNSHPGPVTVSIDSNIHLFLFYFLHQGQLLAYFRASFFNGCAVADEPFLHQSSDSLQAAGRLETIKMYLFFSV